MRNRDGQRTENLVDKKTREREIAGEKQKGEWAGKSLNTAWELGEREG